MFDPATASFADGNNLGGATPVWLSSDDKSSNLSAQPGAPGGTAGDDKFEKPVSAFHSAEGQPALDSSAAREPVATGDAERAAPPAKRGPGRPTEFGDFHKAQVCGLIGAGISQRQAAVYLGFCPSMVSQALRRDKQFARDVARAVVLAQFQPLYKVIKASERSWRAAAWLYRHAQPHTDLAERDARRAARKAEKLAQEQAERDRELRRQQQQERDEELNGTCERMRQGMH